MKKIHIFLRASGILSLVFTSLLVAHLAYASIFLGSPSSCSGSWFACNKAFASNDNYSIGIPMTSNIWTNYNFNNLSITASSSIEIGVEGKNVVNCPTGTTTMQVAISKNGGASFGPNHDVTLPCAEATTWVDVTADFATWASSDFQGPLQVRGTCVGSYYCYLDWIPVQINTP